MDEAIKKMRSILVCEVGIDVEMFSPSIIGCGNAGYKKTIDHGLVQWGIAYAAVAVFHLAQVDTQYIVVGICSDGSSEEPTRKTATASEFQSAVAWIAMER